MCQQCWINKGAPKIANVKVKAAVELICEVYSHHGAGGGLHIVVDDFNIDMGSVQFCLNYIRNPEYRASISEERFNAELKCAEALRDMTEDEVGSAIALYDGYFAV